MIQIESGIRSLPMADYNTSGNTVIGYAAVFNAATTIKERGTEFREVIRPNAFRMRNTTYALYNHNPDHLLGSTQSGTLQLHQDTKGLRFQLELPDTEMGRTVKTHLQRGDIQGASFGMQSARAKITRTDGQLPLHEIHEIDLVEISLCYSPAYPQTEAKMRNNYELQILLREKAVFALNIPRR